MHIFKLQNNIKIRFFIKYNVYAYLDKILIFFYEFQFQIFLLNVVSALHLIEFRKLFKAQGCNYYSSRHTFHYDYIENHLCNQHSRQ